MGNIGKSKRTLVALLLVAGGLAYLISTAVSDSTMYYFTVEEALAKGAEVPAAKMRVNGDIVAGSIDWRPRDLVLAFSVEGEQGGRLDAVYHGPRPDNFEAGIPAILEGRFGDDGVFYVEKLMLACPSRFEAETKEMAGAERLSAAARG